MVISTIQLPSAQSNASPSVLSTVPVGPTSSIVIIGANGSGKTRLGAWLEFTGPQKEFVYRVGAQRMLQFPDSISPVILKNAHLALTTGAEALYTETNQQSISYYKDLANRVAQKWRGDAATGTVDDYKQLLVYLVSEQYETVLSYAQQAEKITTYKKPPITLLNSIKRIWEQVIPHRQLILNASTITVKPADAPDSIPYQASKMSDGERVAFYLIGQCLAVPANGVIVVDEPEVHLHRIIQSSLWNAIEQERSDCLFVYLTHDLDFAASRTEARKIWIKNYDGIRWDWQEVPNSEGMPEEMLLAVLGSRQPVIFTEGTRGSSEQAIFSRLYPSWNTMPCDSCEQVIEATKAFRELRHLHGNECCGIIDRDYRTDEEVVRLRTKGIYVLEVQEVENLLLVEDVLAAVIDHSINAGTIAGTIAEKLAQIKESVFQELAKDQEMLTSWRTGWEIEKTLRKFDAKVVGLNALQDAVASTATLNVEAIYSKINQEFNRILAEKDYSALLLLYNNKGLAKRAGRFFGIQVSYPEFVKRLISGGKGEAIVQALRSAAPVLPPTVPTI